MTVTRQIIHMWHDLPPGPEAPDLIYTVVEVPRGSKNKYEYDKNLGLIRLDRVLFSAMYYPGDYGFIPQTYYDDGDPLDVIVMVGEPSFPGALIVARPIGMFRMLDNGEPDDKILAVPNSDPLYGAYHDISDIPQHYLNEVAHFFSVYKDLQGVKVTPVGWENAASAKRAITHAMRLYQTEIRQLPPWLVSPAARSVDLPDEPPVDPDSSNDG
ncbi:MAG: inorganic diphosphatase [Anaerolineae bacterium]